MIAIIAALAHNGVIGNKGVLPWRLPADLARFSALTRGYPVVMGRKTFESIITARGGPLPNRTNIVISRVHEDVQIYKGGKAGCILVHSIDKAFARALTADKMVWVIGGEEIYRQTMPFADKLYLTEVNAAPHGDAFFPEYNQAEWIEIFREPHDKDEHNEFAYTFVILKRKKIHANRRAN